MALVDQKISTSGELTEDGQYLKLDHHAMLKRIFGKFLGKKLEINFQVQRFRRSDAQNRYIWGVVVPCVQAWYYETYGENKDKDEIYTWLRTGLLGHTPKISMIMGTEVITMTGKRFSKMTTKEFAEAIDTILRLMAERDCVIPEPRQNNFLSDIAEAEFERRKNEDT